MIQNMRHSAQVLTICTILLNLQVIRLCAEDMPPAGRPWFAVCVSSLSQLHRDVDELLQAADQPELSDVLGQRLERWKNLEGLDRERPAGLVRFWPHQPGAQPEEVIFIPATDRDRLMKTVTFGLVDFAKQSPDHYLIARPQIPYHVLFRNDNVAWMGDRTQTLIACSGLLREWTRELAVRSDVGVFWDFRQIPEPTRRVTAGGWRQSLEPLLQRRDDESNEVFALRSGWSAPLVTATSQAIEQTQRVVAHVRFEKDRNAAVLDVRLLAEPKSEWAGLLQSWRAARSPWQALSDDKEVRGAGFIAGLPAVKWPGEDAATAGGQIAWQVFGESILDRVAVLAVSNGPVLPGTPQFATEPTKKREYQRVRVPDVPKWLRRWIGGYPEAWVVRDKGTIWLAFGPEEMARTRLDAALDLQPSQEAAKKVPVCLSARIPLGECLDAIPWIERIWMEQQLVGHEDRIDLTITPSGEGLHLQAVLPIGVLRIIGGIIADDLAREADRLLAAPPE